MDVKTLSRVFAAAFLGDAPKYRFEIPPGPQADTLIEAVYGVRGKAKYMTDGLLHVYPIKYRPTFEKTVLSAADETTFLFLAGITAATGKSYAALRFDAPFSRRALTEAMRAVDGSLLFRGVRRSGAAAGAAVFPPVVKIRSRTPPAFAAGLIVGAVMARHDAVFLFEGCDPRQEHLDAIEAVREFGGEAQALLGGVRILSRRKTKAPLPKGRAKRVRHTVRGPLPVYTPRSAAYLRRQLKNAEEEEHSGSGGQ